MSTLFSPLRLRDVTLRNRIVVSPMCQYSAEDGFANDWHVVHLGSRAVGGAGLVFTEATAVNAGGRISPQDLGIWKDAHVEQLARIARFCNGQGAAWGTQLAHAGRKASTKRPWDGQGAVAARTGRLDARGARRPAVRPDVSGAGGARRGGHRRDRARLRGRRAAHAGGGRLGDRDPRRARLPRARVPLAAGEPADRPLGRLVREPHPVRAEIVRAVRGVWPERLPLFVRLSATDWVEGGWDIEQTVELSQLLRRKGST